MTELEIWKKFDSVKSWDVKSRTIEPLIFTNNPDTFNRICKEFNSSSSLNFKGTAIKMIEILAARFKANEDLSSFPDYAEILNKHKIENVINFGYRNYKKVQPDTLFSILNEDINQAQEKIETEGIHLKYKLPYSNHFQGFVRIHIWHNSIGSRTDNLWIGFITDLRDYSKDYVNDCPEEHLSFQKGVERSFGFFKKSKFPNYKLHHFHEQDINKLILLLPTLFEKFQSVYPHQFEEFKNSRFPKDYRFLKSDLFLILGLINVNLSLGRFDLVHQFAVIGLEKIKPGMAGSGWIEYLESKLI